ncbi:carbohydrate kinase family protein [Pseudomonadota bacterium]
MATLICGSFAYDTIMVFPDSFKNHILPDNVHILNVCFMVPSMRREHGGCAGNIAYNLMLLGDDPVPMGTVGKDFGLYYEWLDKCNINRDHVTIAKDQYTAQAFITTDQDDNQITAFHPGAMAFAHQNKVSEAIAITLGIVSPDGKEGMIEHAEQFANEDIPFVFDPGQGLPMFDKQELENFLDLASYVAMNDYECQLLQEKTGRSLQQLASQVDAFVVTKGGEGSEIHTGGGTMNIPVAKTQAALDPTGCGDAYRAGLLYGINHQLNWEVTGRIASLMGAIKIEKHGTQNHYFDSEEFGSLYFESFGLHLA